MIDTLVQVHAIVFMLSMIKFPTTPAIIMAVLLSLSACTSISNADFPGVYKMHIQQGNVITQEKVDLLQIGLTREQVRYVMGTPLMIDLFNENHWDYLYRLIQGDGTVIEDRVRVVFENDLVTAIKKSPAPSM